MIVVFALGQALFALLLNGEAGLIDGGGDVVAALDAFRWRGLTFRHICVLDGLVLCAL
jgi:hypothetical protein